MSNDLALNAVSLLGKLLICCSLSNLLLLLKYVNSLLVQLSRVRLFIIIPNLNDTLYQYLFG